MGQCVDVDSLWTRYFESRNHDDRNQLVEHYVSIVQVQAARLARKLPIHVGYEEICSAGYEGLIEAVETYDSDRNVKFETFCQQRIIGSVMDWLRSCDTQSRTVRTFEKQRLRTQVQLENQFGRPATQDEISREMGMTNKRYSQLSRLSQVGRAVHFSSMDARGGGSFDKGSDRAWDVSDPHERGPEARLEGEMLRAFIVRDLSREERLIVTLYYVEELTMAEIGLVLNLSESRVSQIHKDILERLRRRFKQESESDQLVA